MRENAGTFSRIRTEYGEIRSMWENAAKMRTRITLNTDTFYAAYLRRNSGMEEIDKLTLIV